MFFLSTHQQARDDCLYIQLHVHKQLIRKTDTRDGNALLLGQQRQADASKTRHQIDGLASTPTCTHVGNKCKQHENAAQQLCAAHQVGHRLAVNGVGGEQQRRSEDGVERQLQGCVCMCVCVCVCALYV